MTWPKRGKLTGWLTIMCFVGVSIALVSIPTDDLINAVGSNNAYILMFAIAFIGSISTFAGVPYPLILMGLAAGGLNPLLLGLISGSAVIISDTITYLLAGRGEHLLSERLRRSFAYFADKLRDRPRLIAPVLYGYACFSPLSNDLAVITMALLKHPIKKVIIPLGLGNLTYNIAVAYLGVYAYDSIVGLF